MKLVLVRHGESIWNRENRFTGWMDVGLTQNGQEEAKMAAAQLMEAELSFDIAYTSYLKRAIHSLYIILNEMNLNWIPVKKTWKLNERHYGALQSLHKGETAKKLGEEQVKLWRRSYDIAPPSLEKSDSRSASHQEMYKSIPSHLIPCGESLAQTIQRVVPYFENVIKNEMLSGKRVLIVAHGNSIRALVKYLENMSREDIMHVDIPTGIPLVYEFDNDFNIISHYYLLQEEALETKMNTVRNQGKV